MIVADTSALVAIVFGEADHGVYSDALDRSHVIISAATLTEALIVVEGRVGGDATRELELLVTEVIDEIRPHDVLAARAAFAAWQRFGKGRHPAGLNLGDCYSYAAAALTRRPLLFKGNNFSQTDIASVL